MAKVVAHRKRRSSYQTQDDYATGLSSAQIWDTLNSLLAIAADPIFEYTEFGIDLCLSLLSASMDKRRKVSIHDSVTCRGILFYTSVYSSGSDILATLQKIGVERNLIVDPMLDALAQNALPAKMLPNSPFTEAALLRHLKQSIEPYLLFRRQVSSRYVKLADSLGKKNAWLKGERGLVSESQEHVNNYMLSVFRAIDKFYPHRGTLASYVTSWMNNAAGSTFNVFIGEAYVVPRSHRRSLAEDGNAGYGNFSLPLEDAAVVPELPVVDGTTDSQQIFKQLYAIPSLFPAMVDFDFPVILDVDDTARLTRMPSVRVGDDISHSIFSGHHTATIVDNLNFNNKRERRRKANG